MSYIMQHMGCKNCKESFNVSLGTFGDGMPSKCFNCGYSSDQFELIAQDWKMNDGSWMRDYKKTII